MGAGFHGGFGNTAGKKKESSIPVNSQEDVRYNKKKTEGYLLNPYHPIGASKAKFMKEILGYSQEDARSFHKNVVSAIIGKTPTRSEQTQYGIKHTYNTVLQGKKVKKLVQILSWLFKKTIKELLTK